MKKNKFRTLNHFFTTMNFYGMKYSINYKNKSIYVSILGIILSFFSILFISFISIYYFIVLLNHSSFSIIASNNYSKNSSINLSNIPIMIGLTDKHSNLYNINEEIFKIEVWMKTLNQAKNSDDNTLNSLIELEYCNISKYKNEFPEMNNYDLSKFLCLKPNQNLVLNGRNGDTLNIYNSLSIYFNICIDGNCTEQHLDLINSILNNSFISIHYLYDNIDHYNYQKPFNKTFKNENFQIISSSFKKIFYYLSSITYISENGIIFNKKTKFKSFTFDSFHLDYMSSNNQIVINNKLYSKIIQFSICCSDYSIVYKRKYIKIIDIFSNIGGFIDFIYLIFNSITIYFSEKNLIVDITENLVCYKEINDDRGRSHSLVSQNVSKYNEKKSILKSSKNNSTSLPIKKNIKFELNSFKKLSPQKKFLPRNTITNINISTHFINSKLEKYVKINYPQKPKIKLSDYFLPFCYLKKLKKYKILNAYKDLMHNYLSLETILPTFERLSILFKEDFIASKIKDNNIFLTKEHDEENNYIILTPDKGFKTFNINFTN